MIAISVSMPPSQDLPYANFTEKTKNARGAACLKYRRACLWLKVQSVTGVANLQLEPSGFRLLSTHAFFIRMKNAYVESSPYGGLFPAVRDTWFLTCGEFSRVNSTQASRNHVKSKSRFSSVQMFVVDPGG